jgi:hypothetical protein
MNLRRSRLGAILIAVGIATIVAAVLYLAEAANGPGVGPRQFAERRGYDRTKESLHSALPLGLALGFAGLGLALAGGRLRHRNEPDRGAG